MIKDKIKSLLKGSFLRKVVIIAGGTAMAQVITALSSPVITRLFSPEDYGVLTVYTSILGILSFGAFQYERSIPIADDDDSAINVLALCFILLIALSILIFLIFLVWGGWILNQMNGEEMMPFVYLIPIGFFLSGLIMTLRQWAYRKRNYKTIAKTTITQSVLGNGVKIGAGFLGLGPIGLVLGAIIRQSAGIVTLSRPLWAIRQEIRSAVSVRKMKKCAIRYKDFPLFSTPNIFVGSLKNQLPIFFLTGSFGSSIVGLYGLAFGIVKIPIGLICESVANVFYAEAAHIGRSNPLRLKRLSKKLLARLALIGLFPLITLLLFGPELFAFVFGPQWREAGVYARIISVMIYSELVFSPVSRVFVVFEKQRVLLIINIFRSGLIVLGFALSSIMQLDSYQAVLIYSCIMACTQYLFFVYAQRIINDAIRCQKG